MVIIPDTTKELVVKLLKEFDEDALVNRLILFKIEEEERKTESGLDLPPTVRDQKKQQFPVETGLVMSAWKDNEAGVVKGDIIRFDPSSAHEYIVNGRAYLIIYCVGPALAKCGHLI